MIFHERFREKDENKLAVCYRRPVNDSPQQNRWSIAGSSEMERHLCENKRTANYRRRITEEEFYNNDEAHCSHVWEKGEESPINLKLGQNHWCNAETRQTNRILRNLDENSLTVGFGRPKTLQNANQTLYEGESILFFEY